MSESNEIDGHLWNCLSIADREKVHAMQRQRDEALRIAKHAVNGWACYAKRAIEHDEIAQLHREIADVEKS